MEGIAVWNFKPERWGSALVQEEKYQGEKTCDKRQQQQKQQQNNNNNNAMNEVIGLFRLQHQISSFRRVLGPPIFLRPSV